MNRERRQKTRRDDTQQTLTQVGNIAALQFLVTAYRTYVPVARARPGLSN